MANGEELKTSIRLPASLARELAHACIDRSTSQQDAIAEGIQLWLSGPRPKQAPGVDPADHAIVENFPRFLREGPEGSAHAVRAIIRTWLNALSSPKAGPQAPAPGRKRNV